MIDFLREQGVSETLLERVIRFRNENPPNEEYKNRIPVPLWKFYGKEIWEDCIAALLSGENLLLVGPKATGKNILAQCLSNLFQRPEWDISFHVNTDAVSLIGSDALENGSTRIRKGPIVSCAEEGGFGILDEINMAKNEALAVLHATLDFRRFIDVPGYSQIRLAPAARFIATMNYGYAGTRDLNEALASRFMIVRVPIISGDDLSELLINMHPDLKKDHADLFGSIFHEIRKKCEKQDISTKPLDLRGLISAIGLMYDGILPIRALEMGMINKCFDDYERQMIRELISVRLSQAGLYDKGLF